jgi:hypothetical protein
MSTEGPAFYARPGTVAGDVLAVLHLPYTVWHLSYVAIGAGLATTLDGTRLVGTLAAFALGLGVGAHALDELRDRPLRTRLPRWALLAMGAGGLAGAAAVAVVGASIVSPWVLAWAVVGIALAAGYALERPSALHGSAGFAACWGAFPVLVGYWAQSESLTLATAAAATAAAATALAQRQLSTPARFVRRRTALARAEFDGGESWSRDRLLHSWEDPLRSLSLAMPALAVALVIRPR